MNAIIIPGNGCILPDIDGYIKKHAVQLIGTLVLLQYSVISHQNTFII